MKKTLPQKSSNIVDQAPGALPPLNALRNFEAVSRHGSFASAATELHVTHWAVGKQIRLLEEWLGIALFERRARGVALTDEGAALLSDISATFDRLANAVSRLRRNEPTQRIAGTVRVNVPPSFALYWLFPRLPGFQAQYPDVNIRLSTTSRKARYIGEAFDIGVRVGHEQGSGVISRTLMADLRLPACSPAVLREHPIKSVIDLRQHTLLHSSTTRSSWSQWFKAAGAPGFTAVRQMEFEHAYQQIAAAIEGMGVALVSQPMIEREVSAGRLICPLQGPLWHADDIALVTHSKRVPTGAVAAFEQWLMAMASPSTTHAEPKHAPARQAPPRQSPAPSSGAV